MCGIVGQVNREGRPVEPLLLVQMCAALEHRGPDARGMHVAEGAGLGIQRLRVIDLVTGDQPIFNEDGTVVVVLNGEIYNYREIRERLAHAGHEFKTKSDTEVIAHLYEEEGSRCVEALHGMFALAIWDARHRRLTLARDRIGKKPLFYAHRDGAITFASELRALLQDPSIPADLDHQALDCYFAYQYVPAPLSAFRAVRKLPPASVLTFDGDGLRIERYWRLDYGEKRPTENPAEVGELIRDGIRRAVRRRMIADVPLGAFLSGGIDSSAVVAAMAEASPQPVKTFSIGFESNTLNELTYARRVAEQFSTDHHELVVRPDAVEMIPKLVRHYGEPFGDSSALPSFYLAEMARRQVTVALNGDGGDESFAGYPRYVPNVLSQRLEWLPHSLRRAAMAWGSRLPTSGRVDSALSRLRRLASVSGLDAEARYTAYVSYLDGLHRDQLYSDEYRELVGETLAPGVISEPWRSSSARDLVDVMLDVDINTYLPGDLLAKMDIASMAYSLEARSPLLDHEFMQMAASLPAELKLRGTEKKVGLRDALRAWLPDDILDRPKRGFEVPIADWLRGDLRDYAHELLLDSTARGRGYFRESYVRDILRRHEAGAEDNARRIWSLLIFESWHRELIDPDTALRPRELTTTAE